MSVIAYETNMIKENVCQLKTFVCYILTLIFN